MPADLVRHLRTALAGLGLALGLAAATPATAAAGLVDAAWLRAQPAAASVIVVDASPGPAYAAAHIPGAFHMDLMGTGARPLPKPELERRLRSWGAGPDSRFVVYDSAGTMWATRLYFDLLLHGVAADRLHLLDGSLAAWKRAGGAVTNQSTPAPEPGRWQAPATGPDLLMRLPAFLTGTGELQTTATVEALNAGYYFGGQRFFDRGGHVPGAIHWPTSDFFNPDGTFKPVAEIRRMAAHLGLKPGQRVQTYCGGGVAATVPFFALKVLLEWPDVGVFVGSQIDWLRDERKLPMTPWARPQMLRDATWLAAWNDEQFRIFGIARLGVIDVRNEAAFAAGHVPKAVSLPAARWREALADPGRLQGELASLGLRPSDEAVIVSEGGLRPDAALAFVLLESLGVTKVSLLIDSVDEWALRGHALTRSAAAAATTPTPSAVPASAWTDLTRPARPLLVKADIADPASTYPRLIWSTGPQAPTITPAGPTVHLPVTELLLPDGQPRPAHEMVARLNKAGVTRWSEVVTVADDPGQAALGVVLLRLLGWPDVKMARP